MPTSAVHSDARGNVAPPADVPPDVPAWLAVRRERQVPQPAPSAATSSYSIEADPVSTSIAPDVASEEGVEFAHFRRRSRQTWFQRFLEWTNQSKSGNDSEQGWFSSWVSRRGLVGAMTSLLLHATILTSLAFFVMSSAKREETVGVWGLPGDINVEDGEFTLDSDLPIDAGESAPLQMTDVARLLEGSGPDADMGQGLRVGTGGKGIGLGESGSGTEAGIGNLRIPGYAQTKGSFSAWADPRNPRPGEEYNIVVLIKLPGKSGKYKASDLTGFVKGTDSYDQKIRYKSNQTFPVEDGAVKILIPVPGAARLVRDTVQVESKMLHEKQTFEIVFDGPAMRKP